MTETCSTSCPLPDKTLSGKLNDEQRSSAVFTVAFGSVEEAKTALGTMGIKALLDYVNDFFDEQYEAEFTQVEVQREVERVLEASILDGTSIQAALEGSSHRIFDYFEMAIEKEMTDIESNEAIIQMEMGHYPSSYNIPDVDTYSKEATECFFTEVEEIDDDSIETINEEVIEDNDDLENLAQLEEQAKRKMEDVVEKLQEIDLLADQLQQNDSDFAQECANMLYKSLDRFKQSFIETIDRLEDGDSLILTINNKVKNDNL